MKQSKHASKTAQHHHHQHPSLIDLSWQKHQNHTNSQNHHSKLLSQVLFLPPHTQLYPELLDLTFPQPPQESSHTLKKPKIPNNKNSSFVPSKSTPHPATDPIQTLTSNPTNIWDNWSLHLCLSFVHHHQHLSLTLYNLPQEPHTLYNQTSQIKPLH